MQTTLYDVITQNVRWWPTRSALIQGDTELDWQGFEQRLRDIRGRLRAAGIQSGDRVAVLDRNSIDFVIVHYALASFGAILVPISFRFRTTEIAHVVEDSDPKLFLYSEQSASEVNSALTSITWSGRSLLIRRDARHSGLWDWTELLPAGDSDESSTSEVSWDDPHVILYTSGTTGRPKGAVISQRRTVLDGMSAAAAFGVRSHESFLCYMPFSHTGAWDYIKIYFMVGGSVVIMDNFDADTCVRLIERHRCNAMFAVPLVLRQMMDAEAFATADLSSMRLIAYGAYDPSDLMPRVVSAFRGRGAREIGIAAAYGLTEGGPYVAILRPEEALDDPNSVGTPLPGVTTALLDEQNQVVEAGQTGEVCVRSPALMDGYWRAPKATEETFAGGWLHTGDIGRLNEHGHLEIVDRKKDMIRTAGENVFAKEVELAIVECPDVVECAVIGCPDEEYDERVVAVVVAAPGAQVTADDVRRQVRSKLAGFKTPKEVHFVDELQKTPAGKIIKPVLRSRYGGTFQPTKGKA